MEPEPAAGRGDAVMTQAARLRVAIAQAVGVGPDFLRDRLAPDDMARAMVGAAQGYVEREEAAGRSSTAENDEARHLQHALHELYTCGSGYLAQRCDAA